MVRRKQRKLQDCTERAKSELDGLCDVSEAIVHLVVRRE